MNLKIKHLLFDSSEIESSTNGQYLIGDEAGYSRFDKMVRSDLSATPNRRFVERPADSLSDKLEFMSEYEFLSLLPANELIH